MGRIRRANGMTHVLIEQTEISNRLGVLEGRWKGLQEARELARENGNLVLSSKLADLVIEAMQEHKRALADCAGVNL